MPKGTATLEPSSHLPLVAVAWLAAAVGLAVSGAITAAPFLVPITVAGTITAGIVAYRRGGALRIRADHVDLRWPVLLHMIRAPIGALILFDMSRGVIPELFGRRAGPGDIAVGVLAVIAAMALPARSRTRRAMVTAWCVFGVADLALAFSTAQYLLFVVHDPRLALIGQLPYALLPLFVVPIMILTHLLVLARLRAP